MKFYIAAAAAAMMSMSSAALAQTTSAPVESPDNPNQAEMTDMDRQFFDSGVDFAPLYSDETRTTLLEGDDFSTAFTGMSEADRGSIVEACERAQEDQGSYGPVTLGLCEQVGAI